jgi:uncharacterized protein
MAKTALITGASAGIGLEFAKIFAADKYNLILVARRMDALQSLAEKLAADHGVSTRVCAADLADTHAPRLINEFVTSNSLQVDVLVNNAGFGARGKFVELDLQKQLDMVQVNISSLVNLTRLFLPGMIERRTGGVLNVASTAAFVPGPLMAVYYATKAFVLSFTEALANEVAGTKIHVSCLCPGATTTEFQAVANIEKSKLFTGPFVMDAATVARMGYDGFNKNETVVVCGLPNQLAVAASRIIPRKVSASVARRVGET